MLVHFVTGNAEKLREVRQGLAGLGLRVEGLRLALAEVQSVDVAEVVRAKAEAAFAALGHPVLVEDTALRFCAWGGLPGPFVKFFERELGLAGMVRALVPFGDVAAEALCALGYHDGRQVHCFTGCVAGTIVPPRGAGGFGWDAIFQPASPPAAASPGQALRTFAELSPAEKQACSMRSQALAQLAAFLRRGQGDG